MNGFLIQGFVQYYTTGDFNGLVKGGIYLFHSTNQSIANTPVTDGILEVLPSIKNNANTNFVIQRITAISSNQATGAIYIRSGYQNGSTWTWMSNPNWITISTSGGTQTIDTEVTENSQNPVTSAGIYNFVENQIVQATDPYIELYLTFDNDHNINDTLLMRFINFQDSVPTNYSDLVASNDFKKALLNNVLIYMGEYGVPSTALGTQGTLMSGNAYFPSPTSQNWYVTLATTIIWFGNYYDYAVGHPSYIDGAWYLTGCALHQPEWVAEVLSARNYTTERTSYTNSNPTTMTVGGIPAGTTFDNESLSNIIESLLYPYVAFNFSSFTTTAASGTFEYGTAKSITAVKPTYTKGSKDLTNMKVGTTSGGSNLYNSSVPNSGTSISLSTPLQLNGLSNQTIYTTITDGTTTTTKSVTFSFPQYYYWANTNSTTAPGSLSAANVIRGGSDADGDVSGVQTDNNSYLFFFVPSGQNKSQIQQYAMSQWNNVDTISMGTVTFLTNTNQSVTTYKAYRTSMLVAGSGNRFRIN